MDIDNKKVAKYLLLPEILPRFRNLFGTGFSYMGYNLALVFRAARLIPENHPYLISSNIGRYGVTHVIALASSNLKLNLKNIDQLAIFAVIFFGLVLLLFQLLMLAGAFFVSSAGAAPPLPTNFLEFFGTPNPINPNPPTHDVAFILLERVLGVPGPGGTPGFFNTCVSQNIGCFQPIQAFGYAVWNGGGAWGTIQSDGPFPWPFHDALRQMMQLYSTGILVVGMLIFLYFMVAVIAETAQTGTPFGKRFNHVWAPLRIVIALGLIVPVANGLNSAQYICLYMAKWGSNFATNGWYQGAIQS
jgi:hypothetical protein